MLATRRKSDADELEDLTDTSTQPSPPKKRVSAAAAEASEAAALRRQNSHKEAELRLVEQRVAAQRERNEKDQKRSSELEAVFENRRSGVGTVRGASTMRAASPLPALLAAVSAAPAPAPAATLSPAAEAFTRFLAAAEASDIQSAYDGVLAALGLGEKASLSKLSPLLAPQLPHSKRQLLVLLEARLSRPEYGATRKRSSARNTLGAAVVGAGPVGLRTAIELSLLGARVEVFEGRERFSRLQVLHLWDWVECDLVELGIKIIDP